MKFLALSLLGCLLMNPFAGANEVNLFDRLFRRNSGTTNQLRDIVDANGTAIAVGDAGTVLISTNLVDWTTVLVPTTNNLRGITWSTKGFLAVGESGTILTSADGRTWILQNSGTANDLNDVAAGETLVAVGQNGTVCESTNGVAWTVRRVAGGKQLNAVAWEGGSAFYAVGEAGTILSSGDGIAWTLQFSGTLEDLLDISEEGWPIAVGKNGTVLRHEWPNQWTVSNAGTFEDVRAIVHLGIDSLEVQQNQLLIGNALIVEGDLHLIPGVNFTDFTSEGVSPGTADLQDRINAGLQSRGTTAWVGQNGAIYSGIPWRRISGSLVFSDLKFLQGRFWGVGGSSILSSPDGEQWIAKNSGTTNVLSSIAYGNGRFVVSGAGGRTLVSTNGDSWTEYPPLISNLRGGTVTFAGGRFYLGCGSFGPFYWFDSEDGVHWVTNSLTLGVRLVYGNGIFLGVDPDTGVLLRSENGSEWIDARGWSTRPALAFGDGVFSSLDGISTDGLHWVVAPVKEQLLYNSIKATYGHSHFLGVQAGILDSAVIASADGVHRVVRPLRTGATYDFANAAAYGNGRFLLALASGLYGSEPLPPFLEIRLDGNQSSVVFHGDARQDFELQESGDITGPWTDLEALTVETPVPIAVASGSGGQRFYRAVRKQVNGEALRPF